MCVYVTETKYAPRNPSSFLLALKEKEDAMKNLFPTELTDSPPEKRKKNGDMQTSSKVVQTYLGILYRELTHLMDA